MHKRNTRKKQNTCYCTTMLTTKFQNLHNVQLPHKNYGLGIKTSSTSPWESILPQVLMASLCHPDKKTHRS